MTIQCPNFNHNRTDPPVGFCPSCGRVVNKHISAKQCSEHAHGDARKRRTRFCVDCGEQLIDS